MARRKSKKNGSSKTPNKRRKGVLSVVLPWLRRFGLILGIAVIVAWTGSWFWWSGAFHRTADRFLFKTLEISAAAGFTVQNILVEGRVHVDPDVIKALINIKAGDPLFSFDPDAAQDLIERMDWVRTAHVQRHWPDTIYIRLEERRPLAFFLSDPAKPASRVLLDREGAVIMRGDRVSFPDLITVTGAGAQEQAPDFLAVLAGVPSVYEQAAKAEYIGGRRWDIELKNGLRIRLPEEEAGLALRRVEEAHQTDQILDRDILVIDVRDPVRFIIRTRPGAVQDYKLRQEGDLANNIETDRI